MKNCLVCGQPIGFAADLPICPAHFVDPRAQSRRLPASSWWFHHGEGVWLLFLSSQEGGGVFGQGMGRDWRAVNMHTGEARSFTYTSEIDVWLDVLGIKPAPLSVGPGQWGQPIPAGGPDLEVLNVQIGRLPDASGTLLLPRLIAWFAATRVPVYGFSDMPFGLLLENIHFSGLPGDEQITGLAFTNCPEVGASPTRTEEDLIRVRSEYIKRAIDQGQVQAVLQVYTSQPAKYPPLPTKAIELSSGYGLTYEELHELPPDLLRCRASFPTFEQRLYDGLGDRIRNQLIAGRARELCTQAQGILWGGLPDMVDEVVASDVQLLQPTTFISGTAFQGDLLYWPALIPVSAFRFEYLLAPPVIAYLTGSAYGIEQGELLSLLEELVVLNDRPDLLAQYEALLRKQRERWSNPDS